MADNQYISHLRSWVFRILRAWSHSEALTGRNLSAPQERNAVGFLRLSRFALGEVSRHELTHAGRPPNGSNPALAYLASFKPSGRVEMAGSMEIVAGGDLNLLAVQRVPSHPGGPGRPHPDESRRQ
jgi:hypothetical protein